MATNVSSEADLKTNLKLNLVSTGQTARTSQAVPSRPGGMRRTMTREQGAALEMIGHAVDYLKDCYLQQGADADIIDFNAPEMIAVRILISARYQILHALPLSEPLTLRLWSALLRRRSRFQPATVLPLSSSR